MRRVPLLVALLAAAVWPAAALVLQPVRFVDLIDDAKAIILGEVTAKRCEKNAQNGRIYTYYTVKVEADDKRSGENHPPAEVVVRMFGGTVDGKSMIVPDLKMLEVGEKVYLFLQQDTLNKDHYRIMSMAQGHFQLNKNEKTGVVSAQGMAPEAAMLDPKARAEMQRKGKLDLSANVPLQADFNELRAAVRQQVLRAENPRYRVEKARRGGLASGGKKTGPAAPQK